MPLGKLVSPKSAEWTGSLERPSAEDPTFAWGGQSFCSVQAFS